MFSLSDSKKREYKFIVDSFEDLDKHKEKNFMYLKLTNQK